MTPEQLRNIIEAALMVSGQALTISQLQKLFPEDETPENSDIKAALDAIVEHYQDTGIELNKVASGYRLQAKAELSPWLSKLWTERAPRYSRAFMETLSIIAYKQPVTRAEIEQIRGVTVSGHIVKTLMERNWVRVIGYKEVPGRPAILGTTRQFLDHFNLKSLSELPSLAEFVSTEVQDSKLNLALALEESNIGPNDAEVIPDERGATIDEELEEIYNTQNEEDHEIETIQETEHDSEAEATHAKSERFETEAEPA